MTALESYLPTTEDHTEEQSREGSRIGEGMLGSADSVKSEGKKIAEKVWEMTFHEALPQGN
jgi:hypothetical protein